MRCTRRQKIGETRREGKGKEGKEGDEKEEKRRQMKGHKRKRRGEKGEKETEKSTKEQKHKSKNRRDERVEGREGSAGLARPHLRRSNNVGDEPTCSRVTLREHRYARSNGGANQRINHSARTLDTVLAGKH